MTTLTQNSIKAVELKSEVQKKLTYKFKTMPSTMSYESKIHKIACSGKLGKWWKSLPKG
jgi:hypothetical protein